MKESIADFVNLAFLLSVLVVGLSGLTPAADYDMIRDGCIDWADLGSLAEWWLVGGCSASDWCGGADFDHSNSVDFNDFSLLAQNWGTVEPYITTLLAGHEPSESHFEIVGPHPDDPSVTIEAQLLGGTLCDPVFGNVPTATEGDYILGLSWDNEIDRKVEYGYNFTGGFTFDLNGVDEIVFDVFVPSGGLLFPTGLIGVWDGIFGWNQSANVPTTFDEWCTVVVDVSDQDNIGLSRIDALVFEDMGEPGDISGTLFVDNVRLRCINPNYYGLTATGHDSRIDLQWRPVSTPTLQGYNIYRADAYNGPFIKLNDSLHTVLVYSDFFGINGRTYYYYITSVLSGGETAPSDIVSATSYVMTDEQLLTSVQEATFRYFWDFAHPVSGLAREGFKHSRDIVTIGGSGFGLMAIIVGVERGFVSRAEAADRILKILTFLDDQATRYYGVWAHWLNGATGETIPFGGSGPEDNGGDIVETAFLVQGMLTVRQYFDSADPVETEIRSRVTQMWEEVDWYWYLRRSDPGYEDNEYLYWHWSPDYGWAMNMKIFGNNECMIAYLLAVASPTHPIPASCYHNGWANPAAGYPYENGSYYYGYKQWVGEPYGGPLFFTHFSFLGFDPRNKCDDYCDYFDNNRNISLINRAHCIANPNNFAGYSGLVWGLTSSWNPWGYLAHSPTVDNGTITPTAAISAMPYVPDESIATLKHFYHTYGDDLWGPFGFRDAFNLTESWFSGTYLAIDEGPIVIMIENYRTQVCWNLFMANPEIQPMLDAIGWTVSVPPPP